MRVLVTGGAGFLGSHIVDALLARGDDVMVVDDLQEGTSKALTMNGTEVAVFRCGNQLYALQNRCPHAGGSLADGTVEGDEVICPLHGYRFNIRTGACATDPALRAKSVALVPHADGFTGAP